MRLIRRLPKIGFSNHKFRTTYQYINLSQIAAKGLEGEIGPNELKNAGLIKKADLPIKILGEGELTKPLSLRAHKFSRSAQEKILQANGQAEVI